MKKDLSSYVAHNEQYVVNDIEINNTLRVIQKYDQLDTFKNQGFERALSLFQHRDVHIDIGSGTGWLLRKTAPIFSKVIGIEPSKAATDVSSKILKDFQNIEYINEDMVDALIKLGQTTPAFVTSSIVFSHIKNFHVANFLKELDKLPDGSNLYFYENYGTNISHKHWYIRSKYWWARNLPNWDITFFDIPNNGYTSGIFGSRVGANKVKSNYKMSFLQSITWQANGIINKIIKLINKISKSKIRLR